METIQNVITVFTENWPEILIGIAGILGGFAVLAKYTPNTSDNKIIAVLLQLVNDLGQNNGKAANRKKG